MNAALQKLKRLATMSPRELAHRVREVGLSEFERRSMRLGYSPSWDQAALASASGAESGFKNYLAGAPSRRFYCGARESLREFVRGNSPSWIDRAVDDADRLCRHEFQLLNFDPVHLGAKIDWHRDAVTGRPWERRFWRDYNLESDPAGRDAKIVLELNRHQHLPRLAKAYALTGDERYAAESVAQLESWIEQNPPGLGINWHSSLEIGIRAISWMWTFFLLLPSRSFDEDVAQRAGESLFAQLEHVHCYTSVFSSPNTHLIGEAAALFLAGLVFRDRKRSAEWLKQGATLLHQEAGKQILEDGVYGELSTYYHSYTLDFFLQALVLAEQNQYALPARIPQQVCAMLQVLMHLTHPGGTVPLLGDDDGGCALGLAKRSYRGSRDALSLGATLFRREDFKHQAGEFSEESLWLLGIDGWESYQRLKSRAAEETTCYCPFGGYVSQRSGWGPQDAHIIFDCGGLGMLTGGHSHADALSVVLFADGRELLADPGTFIYNGAPEWRTYFRSTRAHNTVVVDNRDQVEMGGTFRWKQKLSTHAERHSAEHERNGPCRVDYFEADHDGYKHLRGGGVIHRRRVISIDSKYWILADDFRGVGRHTFDFHFHFGSSVNVPTTDFDDGGGVRVECPDFLLALRASAPLTAEAFRGETRPIVGWLSEGYGDKRPGTALRASMASSVPAGAITLLAPVDKLPLVRTLEVEGGPAVACSYEFDRFTDIAIWSTGASEVSVGRLRAQGEFFWLRMEGGALMQKLAIGAHSLSFDSRNVLEDALCVQSAGS